MKGQAETESADGVAVIIGAGSEIAGALVELIRGDGSIAEILTISRQNIEPGRDPESEPEVVQTGCVIKHWRCDYGEDSIKLVCEQLKSRKGRISRVFICNGILHDAQMKPEKRVEDIDRENLYQVFGINAVIPMLWIKHLRPLLTVKRGCVVTVFSARIGSIEDNHRGGWYAYRASKAALNMMVKTAAIEYARLTKQVQFLLFHPGTTDTPLSKPFQKFVSSEKLFTPQFVAEQLWALTKTLDTSMTETDTQVGNIKYLDWDGKIIPW